MLVRGKVEGHDLEQDVVICGLRAHRDGAAAMDDPVGDELGGYEKGVGRDLLRDTVRLQPRPEGRSGAGQLVRA